VTAPNLQNSQNPQNPCCCICTVTTSFIFQPANMDNNRIGPTSPKMFEESTVNKPASDKKYFPLSSLNFALRES
jgi:hypothetical protein